MAWVGDGGSVCLIYCEVNYIYDSNSDLPKKAVVFFADGAAIGMYAAAYEDARHRYSLPEIYIVGIANLQGVDASGMQRRSGEYLIGLQDRTAAFKAHENLFFQIKSSMIDAMTMLTCPDCRVYIGGYSNGGDWAYTMAARHTELFEGVISLSMLSARAAALYSPAQFRQKMFLAAGIYEDVAQNLAAQIVDIRKNAELETELCNAYTGHDMLLWSNALTVAYLWMLGNHEDFMEESKRTCIPPFP
ncbi:MAG: hypothetical protein LBF16_00420 [Pseudomonadales bacterium]|jgi:predicted esterase|nr:hypothetical protein [Pseudomonadales bacterium]